MFGWVLPRILASCPLDVASRMTTLIISNEEMLDIMKMVKLFEEIFYK